ncbi:MAG: nitrogenase component 1 [Clostridiaceae bacterium]
MYYDSPLSKWNLSELLSWIDMKFIPSDDSSDVENYCSFMGAYEICTMFRGVVPIVHGPIGCTSSFYSTRIVTRLNDKIKPMPFSSCMNSNDVIFGAIDKLENTIKEVENLYKPKLIVVLTTCVSDMISEDVESLVKKIKRNSDTDIISIKIGGISCKGFREGADIAFKSLMDYVSEKTNNVKKEKNSINLFLRRVNGKLSDSEDIKEIERMLSVNGIKINTIIKVGATYDDLMNIPKAEVNASLCYTYGKEVMSHLKNLFNQSFSEKSYPIGLNSTIKWVNEITTLLDLENKFEHSVEIIDITNKLNELKSFLHSKLKHKEMFVWHPGEKALAFTRVAYDLELEPILIGYTYHLISVTRETIIRMINDGQDPKCIIRGHSKLWDNYNANLDYSERPFLFMPKRFWVGNMPCVDLDLFRDSVLGITGLNKIIDEIYRTYSRNENNSIFNKYFERRYDEVSWK